MGAGLGILAACAVAGAHEVLGRGRTASVVAVALVLAIGAHGMAAFVPTATTCLPIARAVPATYAWLAAHPDGAVLDARGGYPIRSGPLVDAATAMLGSLVHGHPVLEIHSHHLPPGSMLVGRLAQEPPTPASLQALVDMTHVRWIVLRPDDDARDRAWGALPGIVPAATLADGRVFEVRLAPRYDWFAALAAGPRPDRTLLGTPLAPVAEPRARITSTRIPAALPPSSSTFAVVTVTNDGTSAWPVSAPSGTDEPRIVAVHARWTGPVTHDQAIALPYDVEPGTTLAVPVHLTTPGAPGGYTVTLDVAQADTRFTGAPPVTVDVR
jgi:hypothetical protein